MKSSVDAFQSDITSLHRAREAWDNSTKPSVLRDLLSASTHIPVGDQADGLNGHRVDFHRQETGFGRDTQSHLPPSGMPNSTCVKFPRTIGYELERDNGQKRSYHHHGFMGKLPKMHFPQFSGDNPQLWCSHCESYFDMYALDESMWIKMASMHFEGPAVRWLQSAEQRL